MFLSSHFQRHADAQMPDLFMRHVDDALAPQSDLFFVGIGVGDPVLRLLRRSDTVAVAGKDKDRTANRLDVQRHAGL
ncbi:hypothetical protein RUM4293_03843 [Ruegeria atlantica]|uniref:Uncharacterized protein n=1 Tax=Ruegeria atlantica TaxID=81569 RepID=A0A0P1E8U0_9RHOB|nr:hypothetical protein RUM4293_03843 [Ruegeria atlantica]